MPRPYWIAQALACEDAAAAPALEGDTRAQLCIVGGGFTGLWTAILAKKAKPELDIVVIEADVCGAGASGRNGGCALTWSTKFFTLQRLYGDAEAVRLVRASEQAVLDIEAFCEAHGIECEWRRHGTLFTASAPAQVGASDAVVAALRERDASSWTKLPVEEVQRRGGSKLHLEGWFSPMAATVQPGKLVRGLRRVALQLGVRLHENTRMVALDDGLRVEPAMTAGAAGTAVVRTPRGSVTADTVVIAINAWMAGTFREFERSIAIVSSDMVITEPAAAQLQASGLDGGISVLDSRIFVHYYRSAADGRLMFGKGGNTFAYGGRMLPVFDQPSPYRDDLAARVKRFIPELSDVPLAASWNGASDRSVTGLPFFGRLRNRPNVFYGFGYSGNGVAPSRMGGEILSSLALGIDNEWTRSPLVRGPLGKFPPEPIRFIGSIVVRDAIRRKESAEDNGQAPSFIDTRLAKFAAAAGKADKG
ncbi:FAD-dependent oxidoreductase [Ramlibacter albus]|uniref:FAD-dependent oxidoreductase n=1 Tax=Ramlibacter albus TaxID=2079448 RepID=A0A923MCI0_9BURK|nr:FAD-dependent oxidoreductase [Ramlibacter albus]MBC5768165.1 FAD-dependent oxidoreductase [Ramlibacter albus]